LTIGNYQLQIDHELPRPPPGLAVLAALVLAGGADELATTDDARAICDRVSEHGRLVIFEGLDLRHSSLFAADPERYRDVMLGLLACCCR
jgi:hypothetical protein